MSGRGLVASAAHLLVDGAQLAVRIFEDALTSPAKARQTPPASLMLYSTRNDQRPAARAPGGSIRAPASR